MEPCFDVLEIKIGVNAILKRPLFLVIIQSMMSTFCLRQNSLASFFAMIFPSQIQMHLRKGPDGKKPSTWWDPNPRLFDRRRALYRCATDAAPIPTVALRCILTKRDPSNY